MSDFSDVSRIGKLDLCYRSPLKLALLKKKYHFHIYSYYFTDKKKNASSRATHVIPRDDY